MKFTDNILDSHLIKLSGYRVDRLASVVRQFGAMPYMPILHRAKERIPYFIDEGSKKLTTHALGKIYQEGILTEKLDGALTNVFVRNNEDSVAASHRISKKTDEPINYTNKIPGLASTTLPKSLKTKSMDLKGEFLVFDKNENVLPHQEISAILNSKPDNAIKKIKEEGLKPRIALFDIWDDTRPYHQKYETLQQISKKNPEVFFVPKMAQTPQEKKELIKEIKAGQNPRTTEGIIWQSEKGPFKVKFDKRDTVYVHSMFEPKEGKYTGRAVGGFNYSLTPGGPPVGKVGTGFNDSLREEMFKNPDKFIKQPVVIEHQGQYPKTMAYRTPALKKVL